ncbi:hypothetical protein [Pelagibacterium lacus]|uniref:Uncharacterized protein n=1 Tax=Pelagibacterium lacus TaxID=2282655 RepID=A0A369WER3_9HYPH|nr:hypothetical protein [Pelagibacterium lacus]RDE10641.1 hypothetical protein DVH29_01450 [Pelagibacterium lacus]
MRAHTPRVLVISNGHGEDAIGAELIRRFPRDGRVEAYPVVGSGHAYRDLCPLVGPRSHIPSQGWRHARGSVRRDLGAMLKSVAPAVRFLRDSRDVYDKVVVIGDAVGLFLSWRAGLRVSIYLDVFKTGYAHAYPALERWVIGRTCDRVFCRDDILAKSLSKVGIDAHSHGNVMMDTIPYGDYAIDRGPPERAIIALLPGSRANTPANLSMQVAALEQVEGAGEAGIHVALATGIAPGDLAAATGLAWHPPEKTSSSDMGALVGKGLTLRLVAGAMGNVLQAADFVLAQAGTATQQALGLGKPVITYNDPANRPKRMADEQALMGESRMLVDPSAHAIADAVRLLLDDPGERARRGAIGRERLGGPGTLDAVLAELFG